MKGELGAALNVAGALFDPFSLLALIMTILAIVLYRATRKTEATYRGLPLWFISAIAVAVATIAFALNVGRLIRSEAPAKPQEEPRKPVTLLVSFYGAKGRTETVKVPFKLSSGQINVGCDESKATRVVFNAPAGARDVDARPDWENARDVRDMDKHLEVQGTFVVATGQLHGNRREWTGNCPAGGHGELVIIGSYAIDQTGAPEQVVLSTFQGIANSNSAVSIPIPQPLAGATEVSCDISLTSAGNEPKKARFSIKFDAAGKATSVERIGTHSEAAPNASSAPISAKLDGFNLAIDVR